MKQYDIVIIGSGLGGLMCGSILARAGKRVLLLEQGGQPGGCIQAYRRGGFSFDTGFHYVGGLGEGQPLHRVFRNLGLLDLPWQRMDAAFDRVTVGGRTFALMQGYDTFVQALADEFPSEREALKQYVLLLRQVEERQLDGLDPHIPESTYWMNMLETSAWQYLKETFRTPLLIDVLSGASLKMELRRESLPLFTFLHGNSSFVESSWRLRGEGTLLSATLLDDIYAHGGELRCHAEVVELAGREDGLLTHALCADGEAYAGNRFVSSLHPAATCRLLKRNSRVKPAYRHRIDNLENTSGMFTASLVIKPGSLRYQNHNHYLYARPDVWSPPGEGEVDRLLISYRVPEAGGDARQIDLLAPMPWKACLPWEHTLPGRRGDGYREMKKRMADACLALAEPCLPGLGESVERCFTSTPLTYRDYLLAPEGTAYGVRKDFRKFLATWFLPVTPVPNLYFTGQNLLVHGVQGVTMTALLTCAELLGKEWVWRHIVGGKA